VSDTKRIMLVECSSPVWLDVMDRLHRGGFGVVYWTGWFRIGAEVQRRFPDAVFHDTLHAKRALGVDGASRPAGKFDDACASVWEGQAAIVYDMMNRFDHSRDQPFVERSTLFYEHLVYWRGVLARFTPDLVVFSTPPHVVYDYVLLALCRELKIKTLMFEEATIRPPYCLAMTDYRDGSLELAVVAQQQHEIGDETRQIVARLRGDYQDAKPAREVVAHEAMGRAMQEGLEGLREKADIVRSLEDEHRGTYETNEKIVNVSSLYKERGVTLRQSFAGAFANSRFMEQRIRDHAVTDELRQFYHAHAIEPDALAQPFAYIALAGQPERTSNPQAGSFANQLLMVNQIAATAPAGWLIAVKEHPNQFHPEFAVNMCRDLDYYRALLAISSVRMLPTTGNPFGIIDRADVVATTGGTSALEAVARGKPALLFGDAWYRDCPGVHRIRSVLDLDRFWSGLAAGTLHPDIDGFTNYVEAITKGCFRGLGDFPPDDWPVGHEENAANLATILRRSLETTVGG
jgi:Capsule polysaccharide biosynthesis protein